MMQVCVLVVAARTGTGVQTVTGVVDSNGETFTARGFFIQGHSEVNTLSGASCRYSDGADDGTGTYQRSNAGEELFIGLGAFKGSGGASSSAYSILDYQCALTFGGVIRRLAKITAVRDGEFDITYAQNDRTGDSFIVVAFGGTDLDFSLTQVGGLGTDPTITLGFQPEALIFRDQILNSGGSATGSGGFFTRNGWAVRDGDIQGARSGGDQDVNLNNARYQRNDRCITWLNTTTLAGSERQILAYSATGYQISGAPNLTEGCLAFGNCSAAAGTLTQPATTGLQEIITGITPRVVLLMSVGAPTSTSVRTDMIQMAAGYADGTRQAGYWTGENVTTPPLNNARYLSNSTVLRFATPDDTSTSFYAVASMVSFSHSNNSFILNWTTTNGAGNEVLWLAIGDEPAPAGTTRYTRRVRRFPLPFEANVYHFLSRLEIVLQSGVGLATGQGSAPILMCRISRDGGHSWGNEMQMGMGAMGEYGARAYVNRLGRGRDFVVEVIITDPVFVGLLEAVVDYELGTS